jgi:hypothetical protein
VQIFALPKGVWMYRILENTGAEMVQHGYYEHPVDWEVTDYTYGSTFFWFGGQYPAPHDITIHYSLWKPHAQPSSF